MNHRTIARVGSIAALATAGLMASASFASASVSVNDGVGFVGKGDVQTALGGINDSALQTQWKDGKIKFTATVTEVGGIQWGCSDGTTERYTSTQVIAKPLTVTANTNAQGKVSNGFNLDGIAAGAGTVLSTETTGGFMLCPNGVRNTSLSFFSDPTVVNPGIFVNGEALPNTPVI